MPFGMNLFGRHRPIPPLSRPRRRTRADGDGAEIHELGVVLETLPCPACGMPATQELHTRVHWLHHPLLIGVVVVLTSVLYLAFYHMSWVPFLAALVAVSWAALRWRAFLTAGLPRWTRLRCQHCGVISRVSVTRANPALPGD